LAVGRRDGVSLDAWLAHAIRHRRGPHRLVPADGPIIPAPAWVSTTGGRGDKLPLPAPLRPPAKGIRPDGLVDPGADGSPALGACEVDAAVLDGYAAAGTLAASLDPTGPQPGTSGAGSTAVIYGTSGAGGGQW